MNMMIGVVLRLKRGLEMSRMAALESEMIEML